jgi:DMSO reductase anchor subunit
MHPASSVILFTTSAGAGYGLLFLITLGAPHGMLPLDMWFGVTSMGLALVLITIGLLSSTFHLGHPERAWRAMSQWRSSWLSREGVVALFTYIPAVLYAGSWVFLGETRGSWPGLIAALAWVGAIATVFCTGQIYASLPTIRQWNHALTTPVYLVFALASGALFMNVVIRGFGGAEQWCDVLVILSLGAAWALKGSYWRGIENYLMREMGFKIARKHAQRLRRIAQMLGGFLPLVTTAVMLQTDGGLGILLAVVALVSGMIGIALERWLFFAQAKHTVQLYYGEEAA